MESRAHWDGGEGEEATSLRSPVQGGLYPQRTPAARPRAPPRPGPSTLHLSALLQPAREQGPRDQDPSTRQGRYAVGRPPSVLLGGGSRGSGAAAGGDQGPPPRRKKTRSAVVVSWVASVSMASASPTTFLQCPGRAQGGRLPKPKLRPFLALSLCLEGPEPRPLEGCGPLEIRSSLQCALKVLWYTTPASGLDRL